MSANHRVAGSRAGFAQSGNGGEIVFAPDSRGSAPPWNGCQEQLFSRYPVFVIEFSYNAAPPNLLGRAANLPSEPFP